MQLVFRPCLCCKDGFVCNVNIKLLFSSFPQVDQLKLTNVHTDNK